MQTDIRSIVLLLLALVTAGCAKPKLPVLSITPEPTIVRITVVVSSDVNPDMNGRASPVVVRAYELKSGGSFSNASFMDLYKNDQALLAADLQRREVLQLLPNGAVAFDREIKPETSHLAFVATYRDWQHARWSALTEVLPNKTTHMVVLVDKLAVTAHPIEVSRPKK